MSEEPLQFVLGVDLDGVVADFYGRIRPIAAEWLDRVSDIAQVAAVAEMLDRCFPFPGSAALPGGVSIKPVLKEAF